MRAEMEGTLWKWTNYFSGWQPRWFVLENGILSYYKSQDDVVNGCKGSIKMAVCDVNVHGTDPSRLDLIIPGEAHFYVKAATPQERQQWLVALGSAKACLTNGKPTQTPAEIPEEQLKAKKSELRLYCDLLMQQVHSVKSTIQETQPPSIQKLNEATSLLSATCDTFIKTLDDCMQLSSAQMSVNSSLLLDMSMSASPSKKSPSTKTVPWNAGNVQRSISVDRTVGKVEEKASI